MDGMGQVAIAFFFIGAGVMGLIWLVMHLFGVVRRQNATITDLQQRVSGLEETARTRMPHEAKRELLDALAVISHTLEEREIDETFLRNVAGHINNAIEVGAIRQGRAR